MYCYYCGKESKEGLTSRVLKVFTCLDCHIKYQNEVRVLHLYCNGCGIIIEDPIEKMQGLCVKCKKGDTVSLQEQNKTTITAEDLINGF